MDRSLENRLKTVEAANTQSVSMPFLQLLLLESKAAKGFTLQLKPTELWLGLKIVIVVGVKLNKGHVWNESFEQKIEDLLDNVDILAKTRFVFLKADRLIFSFISISKLN